MFKVFQGSITASALFNKHKEDIDIYALPVMPYRNIFVVIHIKWYRLQSESLLSLRTLLKRSILHECKTQILYRGNNHFFYNVTLTHVDVEKNKIPRIFLLRATVAMVTETKNRKWQSFK